MGQFLARVWSCVQAVFNTYSRHSSGSLIYRKAAQYACRSEQTELKCVQLKASRIGLPLCVQEGVDNIEYINMMLLFN